MAVAGLTMAVAAFAIDRFVVPQNASASEVGEQLAAAESAVPVPAPQTTSAPLLAERLNQFGQLNIPGSRRDAFAMPTSMFSVEAMEQIDVAAAKMADAPKEPKYPCVIKSVIDGPHPVVVIGSGALQVGEKTAAGLVLLGVDRVGKDTFNVQIMDADGARWTIPFRPGAATPEKR